MGQVLHGSTRTTEVIRRAIQHSEESLRTLAKRHGVNPKTIAKWRKRKTTADLPTGPKDQRSSSLTIEEEAVVVAFRRHTLLPLRGLVLIRAIAAPEPALPNVLRHPVHQPGVQQIRLLPHLRPGLRRERDRAPAHQGKALLDQWAGRTDNRTIKEATVKRYHYDSHDQLQHHLTDFIAAYNYARRLKTLRGLTPYEFICRTWAEQPQLFTLNPHHQSAGPNT